MQGGLQPPSVEAELEAAADSKRKVIFVLERANLEVAKVGKGYQILNCDDHANFLRKHNKDPAQYRPDICHQALLAILDSPLNKSGHLKALYVHTEKNVLIEVNPQVRLPRTFRRFCGLMVQLLQKLSIRATNGPDKLLKVVKGPVTKHLPADSQRIGFSRTAPNVSALQEFADDLRDDTTPVFIVGSHAHGKVDVSYTDKWISVSQFPLSAACCLGRITNALEAKWNIV